MRHELLFEIGAEEIPAGFITPALDNMKAILAGKLSGSTLEFEEIRGVGTPRRLAISVSGLVDRQPDTTEEIIGPPKKVGFDAFGRPTKAAIGFAGSRDASVDHLKVVETPKGEYLMLVEEKKGIETIYILPKILSEIVREMPFPKSMRWGSGSTAFARPIQWLLAIFNGKTVEFEVEGVSAGNRTKGHRFMAPYPIEVENYHNYVNCLREAFVLVDPAERRKAVIEEINRAAKEADGFILPDDELIETVTQLVEMPYALCGAYERRFLALPSDVLITAMREHQKYFAVIDDNGKLMPNFVAVNNTRVKDARRGVEGHQRVLRARLEDALFFFREDREKRLADRVTDLSGVIFQDRLGTLLEKTGRIIKLARNLAEKFAPDHIETVERTTYLAKADLLTAMVNEFPSLQGIVGRDYALLDGEPQAVANGILEHYYPLKSGSKLPHDIIGALVGIADRIDTIAGCFGTGRVPTGTTDPYGLRRLALGLLHIVQDKSLSFSLSEYTGYALTLFEGKVAEDHETAVKNILEFIKNRFMNDLISRGMPAEAVDAVTSISFDNVVDCSMKIEALIAINSQPTFRLLAGAFKRVINIIKEHGECVVNRSLLTETAEQSLYLKYLEVANEAEPLLRNREYKAALETILKMKESIDAFFDAVMVMTEDPDIRENRLCLLTGISRLFLRIGDFSKMYSVTMQE